MALTIDSTLLTIDSTIVTIDRMPIQTIALSSVVFSAALQAPITLSNPTATLTLASDASGNVHQANPIPAQGALSLVGAAVRMGLAMATAPGTIAVGSAAPTVISGLVTPRSPSVSTISVSGVAPAISTGQGSFTPATGFTIASPSGVTNGAIVTISANSGTPFGSKPYGVGPLLWLPADTSGTPSSLGRIQTIQSALLGMTWQSTGGPTGLGCFAGTPSTNTAPNNWGIGIDLPQWSGWLAADPHGGNNGYWFNDFAASTYVFHREKRNFGHLDQNASNSYNGIGNYNTKNIRFWPTSPLNSLGAATLSNIGDMFIPPSDQIFQVESITNSWGMGTDFPSGGGSQAWGQECINATIAAENAMNGTWLADEKLLTSNSTASAADANVMWRVPASPTPGPFALGSIYGFPVTTYHQIGWQMLNSSIAQTLAGNLRGTQSRLDAWQYVVEGNDGSGRPSAPVGAFPQVAQLFVGDSACRVVATNSSTWGSETDLQPQPDTAWSGSSVSFSTYNLPLNWYLYVVNSSNSAIKVGQRTS